MCTHAYTHLCVPCCCRCCPWPISPCVVLFSPYRKKKKLTFIKHVISRWTRCTNPVVRHSVRGCKIILKCYMYGLEKGALIRFFFNHPVGTSEEEGNEWSSRSIQSLQLPGTPLMEEMSNNESKACNSLFSPQPLRHMHFLTGTQKQTQRKENDTNRNANFQSGCTHSLICQRISG